MSFSCCVEKRILVTQQCRSDSVTSSLRRSKVVRSPAQEQREKLGRRGQIYLPACRGRKGQAGLTSAAQGLHLNPLYQNKRMLSWLKKTLNFKQNWKKKNCIDQLLKQGKGQVIWKSLLGRQRVIMNVFSSVLVLPPSEAAGCSGSISVPPPQSLMHAAACLHPGENRLDRNKMKSPSLTVHTLQQNCYFFIL